MRRMVKWNITFSCQCSSVLLLGVTRLRLSRERLEYCQYMLTLHVRTSLPSSSAWLPTFFQQPHFLNTFFSILTPPINNFLLNQFSLFPEPILGPSHVRVAWHSGLQIGIPLRRSTVQTLMFSFSSGCSVMRWTTSTLRNYTIGVNYLSALLGY